MPSITQAKVDYEERLNRCFETYSKIVFIGMENVRSQQVHNIRRGLRGKAEFVMGKRTLQKKIISNRCAKDNSNGFSAQFLEKCDAEGLLAGNLGLVFTNEDVSIVSAVMDEFRVHAPARVGAIAPSEVVVPAGNTGMEPGMTSFFQALNITTKISKGTVEIVSDKKVLEPGQAVDNSTATLLQKLNISPFYYQGTIEAVWDNGVLFSKEDLKATDDIIEKQLLEGISTMTAVALGAGIPTPTTVPCFLMDAFKNLLAASIATEYEFDEFDGKELRQAALEGNLGGGAAAPAAAAPAAAAAAAPAAEEEESDEDMGFGSLF